MIRRPPISTRTDTLFPYPTLFRSAVVRTVRELAGQAELATTGRGLALDLTLGLALEAFVHPVEDEAEQRAAAVHIVRQEMVEMVAHGIFGEARGLGARQPVLGLVLELRIADEKRQNNFADVTSEDCRAWQACGRTCSSWRAAAI